MRIEIRYLKQFSHSKKVLKVLEVDPEILVSELKIQIERELHFLASHLELFVHYHGKFEQMTDDCSLSFYQIQEGEKIMLSSNQRQPTQGVEALQRQKMEERKRQQHNKKFLERIGLFQNPNMAAHLQKQAVQYRGISGKNLSMVGFRKSASSSDLSIMHPEGEGHGQQEEAPHFGKPSQRLTSSQLAPASQTAANDPGTLPTFGGATISPDVPSQQIVAANTQATKQAHDLLAIDEICQSIRMHCPEEELVRLVKQYQIEEAKIMNKQQDLLMQEILKQQQLEEATKIAEGGSQLHEAKKAAEDLQIAPVMPHDIKVDLNQLGGDGYAPLHVACSAGNESIVNYLVFKKQVDPNVKGKDDCLPLEIACWNGHPRIVDMLLKDKRTNLNCNHPVRGSCLHLAAKKDHFQICQVLLLRGIDVTLVNQNGQRAKDVARNEQLRSRIIWYEDNAQVHKQDDKVTDKPINIIKEESEHEAEDEDPGYSSFTGSPRNEPSQAGKFGNLSGQNDSATNLSGRQISSLAASPEERSEIKRASEKDPEQQELELNTTAEKNQLSLPPFLANLSGVNASNSRTSRASATRDGSMRQTPMAKITRRLRAISGDTQDTTQNQLNTAKQLQQKATAKGDPGRGAADVVAANARGQPTNKKQANKLEEEKVADGRDEFQYIRHDQSSQRVDTSQLQKSHLSGISSVSGPDLLGDTKDGLATPTLDRSHDVASQNELQHSGLINFQQRELTLKILMLIDLQNPDQLDYVIKEMKKHRLQRKPYKSFFPTKRIKGTIKKVHRLGVNNYSRYLYVNPIEGVLISYHSQSKFPHSPSYIIKLNEIRECGVLFEEKQAKWFFKRGQYYFIVRSDAKTSYFFLDNLDIINCWTNEIRAAKEFYDWFQALTNLRYDPAIQQSNPSFIQKYDFIIDNIIGVNLPECDLDQYSPSLNIDAATYAKNHAQSFCDNQMQDMGGLGNDQLATEDSTKTEQTPMSTSDGQAWSNATPPERQAQDSASRALSGNSASLQNYEVAQHPKTPSGGQTTNIQQALLEQSSNQVTGRQSLQEKHSKPRDQRLQAQQSQEKSAETRTDFASDLQRMKEMQRRQELPPDEVEQMRKTEPVLIDDGVLQGIGFKSFDLQEVLGHGAFGKVFKCTRKGHPKEYAMKVLKKAFLYRNKHLKYAITECNILKQADHPFVIKMHYSFQTPDNLYMILDYCPGCDLAYHLNKRQIFEEHEAKFFIAEIVLAIEYIHALDVIYRDLKPENILIDADGHCRLADFGLAKENIGEKEFAKSFCGSPAYLPPEMLHSKGVSKSADIYQIGAVLYEFLVGFPPYYTENIKELYNSIRSAKLQVPKYISREGKDLLHLLLAKKPDKRITLDKVKQHEFFKGMDWDRLARKEIAPPIHLKGDDDGNGEEGDEEMQFLKSKETKFKDRDYTAENQLQNRLKQFTFIAGQEQRPGPQPPI